MRQKKGWKTTITSAIAFACLLLVGSEIQAQPGSPARHRESLPKLPLPPRTENSGSNHSSRAKTVSSSNSFVSMAISLGIIVGALVLVGRGMKRFGFHAIPNLPADAFELLGQRTIDPRVNIHLVKCGSRVLVLGVGPEGVRTLSEIDDPAEVERLVLACQNPSKGENRISLFSRGGPTSKISATAQAPFWRSLRSECL